MSVLNELMSMTPEKLELLKSKDPNEYARLLALVDEYTVARAREDLNEFCRYVLRDEQTGGPLSWAPYHEDYLRFLHETDACVVFGHVEMGKTQLGIGYLLWRLGHNPNLRILLLNATSTIAQRAASTLRAHISSNERLHRVFPDLKPGTPWTDEEFCVQRREGITTPTVVAAGVDSSIISFRFDIVWGDDIVNNENTQTAYLRQKVLTWFQNSPMSRTSRNMKTMITVNRWHPSDAAHMLSKLPGWRTRVYPVGKRKADGAIVSYWPVHWPVSRIQAEIAKRTPAEGDRAFFCIAYNDSSSRVQQTWFANALQKGRGLCGVDTTGLTSGIQLRQGEVGIVGVDLGLSDGARADLTSFTFMGMRVPEGGFTVPTDMKELERQGLLKGPTTTLYGWFTGRFLVDVVLEAVVHAHKSYNRPPLIFVESVQAQRWLVDIISKTHPYIQIFPFLTRGQGKKANKHHKIFGVEGLFRAFATNEVEMVCTSDGRMSEDAAEFIDEATNYSPGNEAHTGDRLMSTWIGYAGGFAYMLDHHIGAATTEVIYDAAAAERQKSLAEMSTEEYVEYLKEQAMKERQEANRALVTNAYSQMLLEHHSGGVHVTGIGSFE